MTDGSENDRNRFNGLLTRDVETVETISELALHSGTGLKPGVNKKNESLIIRDGKSQTNQGNQLQFRSSCRDEARARDEVRRVSSLPLCRT